MSDFFKRILFALLLTSIGAQASNFQDGVVLTAAALNQAFSVASITGGNIDGAIIGLYNPTAIHATTISATVANPSLNYQSPATGSVARSYESKFGDTVSVLDFSGCDPTGAADSTACFNSAVATGKSVHVPKGTYIISSNVAVSGAQIIYGDGPYSTVIMVNGSGYDGFTFTANGGGVEGVTFNSAATRTSGYYETLSSTSSTFTQQNYAENLYITNGSGIHVSGPNTTLTYIQDSTFYGITSGTGIGILIDGGAGTVIGNVQMDNPNASQPLAGIELTGSGGVIISNTDVVHSGTGLNVIPNSQAVNFLDVTNSEFDSSYNAAINISPSGTGSCDAIVLDNVWASATGTAGLGVGINVNPTSSAGVNGLSIINPRVFNNGTQGILITGNTFFTNIVGGQVGGNSVTAGYPGVEIGGIGYFSVTGITSGQVAGSSNTQTYGLQIDAGAHNFNVNNNNLLLNINGGLLNNGNASATEAACNNSGGTDANCNATTLQSGTWQAPGTIGSTTPNSGAFTSLVSGTNGTYDGNIAGLALPGNNTTIGSSLIGWNYSNGGGETDLVSAIGGGNNGGFRWYQWNGSVANQTASLSSSGILVATGASVGAKSAAANATVGNATLPAAQMLTGNILRSGSTAAYTDTTDTAANIIASIPGAVVGVGYELTIANTVAFADTIAAGTGVTLVGNTAIAASSSRKYVVTITNVTTPAVTLAGVSSAGL
ncbi:MAG: beta strand repeat-containing protein [Thiobacillus sp.]